jgi:cytochrome bd-type quinol oxidase subunit 2
MNETYPMTKPSLTGKLALIAVFFFCVSSFALFWVVSTFARSHDTLGRIGFLCTLLCALGALVLSWSIATAYLARIRNWSSHTCMKAGLPLAAVGILLFISARGPYWNFGMLLANSSFLAGYIVRRLVYPELTDEEAVSQKPLTLFPR